MVEGITDAMKQYGKATEEIFKNKPKHGRAYGIRRPYSENIVAALAGIFLLFGLAAEFM